MDRFENGGIPGLKVGPCMHGRVSRRPYGTAGLLWGRVPRISSGAIFMTSLREALGGQACADVGFSLGGEVFEDLGFGHAPGKIIEHIVDGDAQAANAGLAAALARLNR